jgi:uncharacterized iron-regulated membrane protein
VSALGLVVAVVAVVALQHPDGWSAGQPAAATVAPAAGHTSQASSPAPMTSASSHRSTASAAAPPSVRLPLVVVNSTGRLGLAAAAADTFRSGGWTVSLLANYAGPVASSCAYYDPAVQHAQDAALGLQRQFPAIRRVAARFDPLPAGPVVVVLADDYAASPPAGPSGRQRDTGAMR